LRATCLLLASLAACTADDPPTWGDGISCELRTVVKTEAPAPELDLVLVVSDAPGMATYRDALIANLRASESVLGLQNLRVTVVDGTGDPRPTLLDRELPWFWCDEGPCRYRNYDGALGDSLATLGAVEPTGTPAPPLFERLEDALADSEIATRDSLLGILFIGFEDDGSSGDPVEYAQHLRALREESSHVAVSVITGAETPRFEAFRDEFSDAWPATLIDGETWIDAFLAFDLAREDLSESCLDPEQLAGGEPDCVAEEPDGTAIPPCVMLTADRPDPTTPLPCLRITPSPTCAFQTRIERLRPESLATLRCACAAP
jgi:hypothetical protein